MRKGALDRMKQTMEISQTKIKQHVNISIPNEVVVKILQRVPCQDLRETLKKVCMQWCSIIYSGSFAYSHVEHGILKSSSSFSQLEAVVLEKNYDTRSVTVSALDWHSSFPNYPHQEPEENWETTYPHQEPEENWETTYMFTLDDVFDNLRDIMSVNSVNGFVCFWSYNVRFHICNPTTKDYFMTPPYTRSICPVAGGFGFCQLSYEYKLILLHDAAAELDYAEIKPLVFTVGTDRSWRSLKAISDRRFFSGIETAAHVKGVLYWYLESYTDLTGPPFDCTKTIKILVCFDVSKEEAATIMVPAELDSQEEGGRDVTRIAEKGGNLCLINISYGPMYSLLINVYIAQSTSADLGSLNSWKKEFNVNVPNLAYGIGMNSLFVSVVTDDMLVIRISAEIAMFIDAATGMLLSVCGSGIVAPYVPSLVSLCHRPR